MAQRSAPGPVFATLEGDIAGSRSPIPVRSAARGGRSWVRTVDPGTLLMNDPDGWVANQGGPAWFLSTDVGPSAPDWGGYGLTWNGWTRNSVYGGRPVDEAALGRGGILPAITRATNIMVGPVVGTTWRYYRNSGTHFADVRQGDEVLDRPLWTVDPQLVGSIPGGEDQSVRPTLPVARRLGPTLFWETLLTHALWWGTGAMMYVPDAFGQPLAGTLRIINPTMWGYTDDGRYVFDPDSDDPIESNRDGVIPVNGIGWRMALLHGLAPVDGATPQGVLTRSGLVMYTGERMNSYLGGVLGTGVPSGVLKVSTPNFDETDATQLKDTWMKAHGGVKRSVAVLNAGVDFNPLQLSLVDSDLVKAKGAWLVDIAHAFTLSAAWLDTSTGTGSNITYANLGERRRDLLDHSLAVPARHLEDFITALLPYGTSMRVDWSGYLSTDPSQQLEFVAQGLTQGYMSPAEGRDRLGLHPRPDAPDELGAAQPEPEPPPLPAPVVTEGAINGNN